MKSKNSNLILAIGEILFDIFPDYKRMGGAPFNFAFHMKSLGFPVIFVSRVGNDENGARIRDILKEKGMNLDYVQTDLVHETGYVQVELDEQGVPDFDIVKDVAYDYLDCDENLKTVLGQDIAMIYYGTLIQRTPRGAEALRTILENKRFETKCFYDINLRKGCHTPEVITASLEYCDILKLSREEAEILQQIFNVKGSLETVAAYLQDRFSIKWISLTSGAEGSLLFTPHQTWTVEVEKNINIADTVGAGDAYAAMLAAGYLSKDEPEQILKRATAFASAICGIKGAVPDNHLFYKKFW